MEVSNTQKWRVVVVITLGMFMAMLDNSIVSVTLPQMQKTFNANVDTITWVITAYFLAQAAVIPIVGYLSDLIGSKRVFLITLGLFTAGSVLCAISPTKEALIAFRVVQGIGGGALLPVGFAIAYRTFPPTQRASITAIISIPIIMAPSFGPTLGGFLGTSFNWNAIFTINIPFGVAGLVMGYLFLQKDTQTPNPLQSGAKKRFDIVGLLLSMVGFTTLVYGISQASTKSWTDQTVLIPLLIGGAVLLAFVVVELRVSDPVMDLRLFMNYTFSIANVLTWLLMAMVYGGLFLLPTFFENVKGDTALTAGVYMITTGVATGVGLAIGGKIYNRVGPRFLIVSGMILLAVGTYGLTQLTVDTTGESLQFWLFVRGVGVGFTTQSLQVLALSVVSNRAMARASSLYNVMRQVAGAIGIAALAAFLTQQATTHATDIGRALQVGLQTHQLTGDAAACARIVPLTPQGLQACVVQHATATGMSETFLITLIFYAVCAGLGLIVGRDPTLQAQKLATAGGEKVQIAQTGSGKVQVANTDREKVQTAQTGREKIQIASIHNIISTLGDDGDEVIGPEILLWRYPASNIVNSSLLTVESNQFCVLKLRGTIVDVYETGQHIVQTPDRLLASSVQLAFNGEPIPLQYEAIYINRAKLLIKTSGVALSRELAEVDYNVDYYIYVATREDAIKLIQHMPQRGHALSIGELNVYAWPIIEETVSQLLQSTPLEQTQQQQMAQDFSQLVHQRLQPFLATYGITLDMVKVQGRGPHSKHTKELISLKALGLSDLDAVHHYIAMNKSGTDNYSGEQQAELERSLYLILHKTLSHYADEIHVLQADLEKIRVSIDQSMDSYSTRLQELSRTINADLQACASVLETQKASTPVARETQQVTALPKPRNTNGTGKFRVHLAPMEQSVATTTEPVGAVRPGDRPRW